ncbi:MAG: helix-turn-helix transcriptional regulator [Kiritimatiellae bacterium]|nr:helix-turn-helix transcriptional regulator [Kiritimatiellia bacterium]
MGKDSQDPSSAKTLGLAHTVAGELVTAIGKLEQPNVLGGWPDALKPRLTRGAFTPAVTPEAHRHKMFELSHVVAGRCLFSIDFRHYRMRAGDVCLLPPDLPHCETHTSPPVPYRAGWWGFTPSSGLYFLFTDFVPERGFRSLCKIRIHDLSRDARDAAAALEQFATAAAPPPVLAVKEALLVLAVFVLRWLTARVAHEDPHAHDEIIEDAKQYIAQNIARPLSLAEVAQNVMLSPNYLTTLFRRITGTPLGTHIARERIGRAKDLLATTEMSVKDVGFALGFEDPYTFSRAFKRVEGISPQAYRRKA